ncbi:unnamed protein product [Paramecium sonneborni]|uniref:K Homology domain-containing protein n=1 Tax=Paramecium sonneborni TaxID=65129 RepID=A0A8S1PD44_9CILI|nr:unnamed protein product [Paramecium sonneborni]
MDIDQEKEFNEENNQIIEEDINQIQNEVQDIQFQQANDNQENNKKGEIRRVPVPPHRVTPLKNNWDKILTTIVENMKLQIRMNTKKKCVEIKTSQFTEDKTSLQRGVDFLKAFMMGFDIDDSVALLRLDDLYVESFEVKDVKTLHGDHLSRCIGRISGEKGKTKFAIENATRTRIVLADQRIHILGSYSNIKAARDAICALILGSPPGKVYSQLKSLCRKYVEKS